MLLQTLSDNKTQRVILNGQNSSCANVDVGVHQSSILAPLLFLIYINDLSQNLASNLKLFAHGTSLFSVVEIIARYNLNKNLKKISEWTFQCKMNFNPDPAKQAQKQIFSRKVYD